MLVRLGRILRHSGCLRQYSPSLSAVQQWISALLSQRKVGVQVGSTYIRVKTQCGLPQGGGLPSTLWSLVADSLLKWLSKQGVFAQGFADDGGLLLIGKALNILCEVMQRILHGVEKWCMDSPVC